MLKPYFKRETTDAQRKPIYFFEEALNELKCLQIGSWHAKLLSNYDPRMDKLEELHLSGLKDINTLYVFLHNNPNLVSLWLNDSSLKELVPLERLPSIGRLGVVPKMKSLNLANLGELNKIGFERDAILRMIESLTLKKCPLLQTLAPSSVFLSHLTNLEVVGCKGLKYLISPSTAGSLIQLNTMKVMDCESLLEIVSDEEQEKEEKDGNTDVIVFQQLTTLELVALKKLQTFCSFKSFSFEFPRLEKFVVNVCPKLENFSQGESNMPMLQKVYVAHEKEKMTCHWGENLKDTLQYIFKEKKFFECMDTLRDTDHFDYLKPFWEMNKGLQEDLFKNLKSLKLRSCHYKSYAIPSNVLLSLKVLEELEVASCGKITSIFEMDNFKKEQASFQLRKLTLHSLEDVKHVWQHNKQEVIHVFENLQQVTIISCDKLESVFPEELAKKLTKLEKLHVTRCKSLVEIVGKKKGAIGKDEGAIETTQDFVFPELNELLVYGCNDELELFQSHQPHHLQDQSRTSITRRQPFFVNKVAAPKVRRLHLDPNQAFPLSSWLGQSENELLPCLIELQLYTTNYLLSFLRAKLMAAQQKKEKKIMMMNTGFGEKSVDASQLLKIMEKCPKLEIFGIYRNKHYWKSIDIPEGFGNRMRYLKEMSLNSLHELESISGLEYLLNLKLLLVSECPKLTTLGQNCSNLKELDINSCGGLKCIFTSSAAKHLNKLEAFKVSHCDSLKEIVGEEQQSDVTESTSTATNDIEFKCLQRINLLSLNSLECFYSGNAILKLPSLTRVNIERCLKMKKFSHQRERRMEPSTPVKVSYNSSNDDFFFHDDLDVAVAFNFLQQESVVLSDDHPVLEVVWPAKMHMPKGYVSGFNLKRLVVERCEFLKDAIIPFHLFPFLNNLEELEVRRCKFVKAIFVVEDTSNMIVIPLKKMILDKLASLTHVWNKDLNGSLSLPNLEEVTVIGCKSIKNLLPTSVAMGGIKMLDVRNCGELVEIVAKDETATEETNEELIMFPMLDSLTLWNLPNLTSIYVEKKIQNWPKLRELDIYRCKSLKKFAPESIYSAEKVVSPHLEKLLLDKEGVMMIEQEQSYLDFQNIRCLTLQGFNDIDDEPDAFPFDFFSKVSLPNIGMLVVADSAFKEIFPSKLPDTSNYAKILSGLKNLELRYLHKLQSTGLDLLHTWVASSNLTWLKVECCASLKYLFTSSTFKCLVQLQHFYIINCEELQRVIVADQPHGDDEVITLECLKILSLSKLPKLESFYNGKSTLNFTGYAEVFIRECKSMKTFSHGDVKVPDSWSVKIDGVSFSEEDNPNAIVSQQFLKGSNTSQS